jgi:hypothetical protein
MNELMDVGTLFLFSKDQSKGGEQSEESGVRE